MRGQWYEVRCPKGCFTIHSYKYENDEFDDDEECGNCSKCGAEPETFTLETSTSPEFFISVACSELEDSNHHSIVNMPKDVYNEIKTLVPEDKRLELAKIIYDQFRDL